MTTAQAIVQKLEFLPEDAQKEVLDFVEFIESRKAGNEEMPDDKAWSMFSLASAMRGMEDEEAIYSPDDIKESFR
jgi:hypothetical protein